MKLLSHAAAAKSLQSCPTLWDPIDGSPPGSPVSGILQARTLEWVAISFSNAWKWKAKVKSLSRVRLLATPWTAAYQAPPSMGFSNKSTGVGCHCLLCLSHRYPKYKLKVKKCLCIWWPHYKVPPRHSVTINSDQRTHFTSQNTYVWVLEWNIQQKIHLPYLFYFLFPSLLSTSLLALGNEYV